MNTGVSVYCFNAQLTEGETSLEDVVRFVGKETEADCIEPLDRYWAEDRDVNEQAAAFRQLCNEVGLQVSCYTLSTDFAVYDEQAGRACIEKTTAALETAQILGTDIIRLDPHSTYGDRAKEDLDLDDVIARMAGRMAEIADAAAAKNMKAGIENHGRLVGRCAQVAKMVELGARPNLGVNLDPTNFHNVFGEDHIAATRTLAKHVVHVHAKDFRFSKHPNEGWTQNAAGEYMQRVPAGAGDAGWPEMLGILREHGYTGTVSVEISLPDDVKGSVAEGVTNIARLIAKTTA